MKKNLFSDKIKYLFETLEYDEREFVKLFWDNDPKTLATRSRTVESWRTKDIVQPKGFKFEQYKIATLTIDNGEPAFRKASFTMDSFEDFQAQVDAYIRHKNTPTDTFQYKYIYYYDTYFNKISYVELQTIKKIHNDKYRIKITFNKEYDARGDKSYIGDLIIDKNYYHISAKNSFEIISFYFIQNLGFKNDDAIYGLRLGKAYKDGLPLSAKNLLTKNQLSKEEEQALYLNINETEELKSKEAFFNIHRTDAQNYLKQFQEKIAKLSTYSSKVQQILQEEFGKDIYHNIMSKEFFAFSKLAAQVENNNSFYIHNIRRASKIFLKGVAKRGEECYIVTPLVENLTLLNEHDPKAEKSLTLNLNLAKNGLKIYRIFVVEEGFKLTPYIKTSIQKMIESGIEVNIAKKNEIQSIATFSHDFIYSQQKNITIYQKLHDKFYTFEVSTSDNIINDIESDYKKIKSKSYSFEEFIKEEHHVNQSILEKLIGEHFHYFYGSKEGKNHGQLYFWNNRKIIIDKEQKIKYFQDEKVIALGKLSIGENQSCIRMIDTDTMNSISITFDNTDITYDIFRVIMVDKQYMRNRDMVSLGLFSKRRLEDNTAQELIGDEEKSIFKISSDIKDNIAEYCAREL